ncbi:MAG TPA: carboxypeptidase-like regulatory domain-containing protein [Segetibacter sp.]
MTVFLLSDVFSQKGKGGIISGQINDAQTKLPLIEAVITLSSNAFEGQKFVVTDNTGRYKINNLPAGSYSISFEMEGYQKYVQDRIILKEGTSVAVSYEMVKEKKRGRKDQLKVARY